MRAFSPIFVFFFFFFFFFFFLLFVVVLLLFLNNIINFIMILSSNLHHLPQLNVIFVVAAISLNMYLVQ